MNNFLGALVIGFALGALSLSTANAGNDYLAISACVERTAIAEGFPAPYSAEAWDLFAESCI